MAAQSTSFLETDKLVSISHGDISMKNEKALSDHCLAISIATELQGPMAVLQQRLITAHKYGKGQFLGQGHAVEFEASLCG